MLEVNDRHALSNSVMDLLHVQPQYFWDENLGHSQQCPCAVYESQESERSFPAIIGQQIQRLIR